MSKNTEVKCYWKPDVFAQDKRHTNLNTKLLHSLSPKNKWPQKLETGSFPASPFLETPHTCLQYNTWKIK